ncbi:hypothetical protein HN512_05085 [Candidatus Peregrinibacteria bacterium]|jgi:hypothetical protein|nr:hypothetical protein [Candidatus Peregrinibacteria bacterium]MBT3599181.1 hypothetical protein [Candidatus Peregrinibacteria bacterium]MBT4366892.1 hypothetical protein [Candidatus Peregrinibacteria bacterium]MBT4585917.1 hypothetical protein [Candidatus Peregrinibacteria bacterium]MBT6730688.1 hypothetical protein [Candidatus Peregrinibacteria bacterium]
MPLKHTTETLLIFVLAVSIIVTGMLLQTLQDVPNGIIPWAVIFVIACLYPLSLSRLFRRNRADKSFRLLHWFPAAMLGVWLVLQGIAYLLPSLFVVLDWFVWGWSLPAVTIGFLFIIAFVFKVIRRWSSRLALLLVAFIPFAVGSVANEYFDWSPQMASLLWSSEWLKWQPSTGTGGTELANADVNFEASEDESEEQYRDRLRAIESRRERIERRVEERELERIAAESSSDSSTFVAAVDSSEESSAPSIGTTSSLPTRLPSSGFGWSAILVLLAAGYCAALHKKTADRLV